MQRIDRNRKCFKYSFATNLTLLVVVGSVLVFSVEDIDQQETVMNNITNTSIQRQTCQELCSSWQISPKEDQCCSEDLVYCKGKQECKSDLINSMKGDIAAKYVWFYFLFALLGFFLFTLSLFICLNKVLLRRERERQLRRNNEALEGLLYYVSHLSQAVDRERERRKQILTESLITDDGQESCAVCLDSFEEGKAVVLACRHVFHRECIGNWMDLKNSCPVCRAPL